MISRTMSHYWLLITCTWFGSVTMQYINTGPGETIVDYPPIPYLTYFNLPSTQSEHESYQNEDSPPFYQQDEEQTETQRKRRTIDDKEDIKNRHWLPNLVDTDKTTYLRSDGKVPGPFVLHALAESVPENVTDLLELEKKSFSPWGGKRSPGYEHTWTWKRALNLREPSMPKRVRFSPWGGKRSGQMIYKPSTKDSRIIFSTSVPELTRIVSSYSPNGESLAGFQVVPTLDKRNPIKLLAITTRAEDGTLKEALPYNKLIEALPRLFKSGHPFLDVNLKKDGKRKVKFSAWGGKRSPPIIGPIWTPAPDNVKESTLDAILLVRNTSPEKAEIKAH